MQIKIDGVVCLPLCSCDLIDACILSNGMLGYRKPHYSANDIYSGEHASGWINRQLPKTWLSAPAG